MDETGHKENRQKYWTWCFRAQLYTLFRIDKSRGSEVLVEVLGTEFNGVLGCDYFSAYRKYMRKFDVRVQFCLAHLIRDVKFLLTLPGREDQAYGQRLREALRELFAVIHRRETMTAAGFQQALEAARNAGALGGHDPRAGHETCPQPGQTLSQAWRGVLPLRHHAGDRADQQPGRTGDSLCGDRPADYPGDAERERPPVVRAHLDGDCHLRPARSRGLSVLVGFRPSPSLRRFTAFASAVRPLTTFLTARSFSVTSAVCDHTPSPRERLPFGRCLSWSRCNSLTWAQLFDQLVLWVADFALRPPHQVRFTFLTSLRLSRPGLSIPTRQNAGS